MDYDASGNATEVRAIAPAPGESPAAACAAPDSPRCLRERIVYDAGERAIAMTDPLGNETRAEYDTRGRVVRTVSPLGAETRREYDLGGNLVRAVDPVGAETRFVYVTREVWRHDGRAVRGFAEIASHRYGFFGNRIRRRHSAGPGTRRTRDRHAVRPRWLKADLDQAERVMRDSEGGVVEC